MVLIVKTIKTFFLFIIFLFRSRYPRTFDFFCNKIRVCPVNCVSDNFLDFWNVICRVALVAWLEVENSAKTLVPSTARTENFATIKPANENKLIWCWHVKALAIHLFNCYDSELSEHVGNYIIVYNSKVCLTTPATLILIFNKN